LKRFLLATGVLLWIATAANAQSLDDLNIQIHGYATQGFLYTTNNNWNTTNSTDGSAAWTEAVVNLSAQPESRLRIGVQARYSLLGTLGNQITLDWAQADYKVNEHFGFRVGKVKSPSGLLNETQDIDPSNLWILLPQSIYPLASRNTTLAHYGGVVYGTAALGESLGKIEYRAFGGERVIASDDGYLQDLRDLGFAFPNGIGGFVVGATLRWNTPIHGLMLGATETFEDINGALTIGPYQGTLSVPKFYYPYFYGKYERNRLMVAGEYARLAPAASVLLPGAPPISEPLDTRSFYVMTSYKLTEKLSGGAYYSYSLDHQEVFTSARHEKDWTVSARYDLNPYLYAKLEQHFVDGTEIGFSTSDNSNLQPRTRMTLLKLGVSF
jgi:hypothetical protein